MSRLWALKTPIVITLLAMCLGIAGFLWYLGHKAQNISAAVELPPTAEAKNLEAAAVGITQPDRVQQKPQKKISKKQHSPNGGPTQTPKTQIGDALDFLATTRTAFNTAQSIHDVQQFLTPSMQDFLQKALDAGATFSFLSHALAQATLKSKSKDTAEFTVTAYVMPTVEYHGVVTAQKFSDGWKFTGFRKD